MVWIIRRSLILYSIIGSNNVYNIILEYQVDRKAMGSLKEAHTRTIVKSISWRVIATLTTITIVYIFTKKPLIALEVGFFEVIFKILFYYLHERGWGKIAWGKKRHPLAGIPVKKEITPDDLEKIKKQLQDLGYMD